VRLANKEDEMAKIEERIAAIESKLQQLKALQHRRETRARSVLSKRERRDDSRRKFLVGAVVLKKVETGEIAEDQLKRWLDPAVSRPEDRALFELDASTSVAK
jgi:transposase